LAYARTRGATCGTEEMIFKAENKKRLWNALWRTHLKVPCYRNICRRVLVTSNIHTSTQIRLADLLESLYLRAPRATNSLFETAIKKKLKNSHFLHFGIWRKKTDSEFSRAYTLQFSALSKHFYFCNFCEKCVSTISKVKSCDRWLTENHRQAIRWCQFRWSRVTSDPNFKVALFLEIKHVRTVHDKATVTIEH